MPAELELLLMRHGSTEGNELRRYVGRRTDEPLSELGHAQCLERGVFPEVGKVYVSPALRARQTAAICFPNAEQQVVDGLEEFDFGAFEGRTADEMAQDDEYRAWVDGWCVGRCPRGESRADFVRRVNGVLEQLLQEAAERGETRVIVVAHAGTIMAALHRFATEHAREDGYFEWQVPPCGGYELLIEPQSLTVGGVRRV